MEATNIEQSKNLIRLGLDPATADMSYSEEYFGRDENGNDDWCCNHCCGYVKEISLTENK